MAVMTREIRRVRISTQVRPISMITSPRAISSRFLNILEPMLHIQHIVNLRVLTQKDGLKEETPSTGNGSPVS